jgi:hypothetical protein
MNNKVLVQKEKPGGGVGDDEVRVDGDRLAGKMEM